MENDLFETDVLFDKFYRNEASKDELKRLLEVIIHCRENYEWCVDVLRLYKEVEGRQLKLN